MAEILNEKVFSKGNILLIPIVAESFDDADNLETKRKVLEFAKTRNATSGIKQLVIRRSVTPADKLDETKYPKAKFPIYAEWETMAGISAL